MPLASDAAEETAAFNASSQDSIWAEGEHSSCEYSRRGLRTMICNRIQCRFIEGPPVVISHQRGGIIGHIEDRQRNLVVKQHSPGA
jgi:hypothetical protein